MRYSTTPYTSHHELLPKVDAAIIVVPTRFHFDVARDFLEKGKALLIEKPITIEPE
jgi:predicted dehydrogenase